MDNTVLFATEVNITATPYHYCFNFQCTMPPIKEGDVATVISKSTVFLSTLHFDRVLELMTQLKQQNDQLIAVERNKSAQLESK